MTLYLRGNYLLNLDEKQINIAPHLTIDHLKLSLKGQEKVGIVGDNGCGKSTLLRMIGGLDTATSGKIVIQDRDIIGPGADRGMVFQSYTLFPWMTVGDNIKFGLKLRKMPADQQEEILNKYLKNHQTGKIP